MIRDPILAGIELGGTKLRCVISRGFDVVSFSPSFATTTSPTASLQGPFDWLSAQAASFGSPRAIGVACFGPVGRDKRAADFGVLGCTPKPGWQGFNILAAIQASFPTAQLALDSDVNAAALSEAQLGAARGIPNSAYVTIGTGIGVGVVVDGKLRQSGSHLEAGHMRIQRLEGDNFRGVCPFHGDCWEGLCSGPALAARSCLDPKQLLSDWSGWPFFVEYTAIALSNIAYALAPDRIVLGGGVMGAGQLGADMLISRIRLALGKAFAGYAVPPAFSVTPERFVVVPALGDRAGVQGALLLARESLREP